MLQSFQKVAKSARILLDSFRFAALPRKKTPAVVGRPHRVQRDGLVRQLVVSRPLKSHDNVRLCFPRRRLLSSDRLRYSASFGSKTADGTLSGRFVTLLEELRSTDASISWSEYLRYFRNLRSQLTDEEWKDICGSYTGSKHIRPLLAVAGTWFNPIRFFEWVASPDGGAMNQLFRCIEMKPSRLGTHEVLIELRLRSDYELPPNDFWDSIALV